MGSCRDVSHTSQQRDQGRPNRTGCARSSGPARRLIRCAQCEAGSAIVRRINRSPMVGTKQRGNRFPQIQLIFRMIHAAFFSTIDNALTPSKPPTLPVLATEWTTIEMSAFVIRSGTAAISARDSTWTAS